MLGLLIGGYLLSVADTLIHKNKIPPFSVG